MSERMTHEEIRDFVDLIYSWLGGSEVNGKTTHDIHLGAARQKCEQLLAALEAETPCACAGREPLATLRGYIIRQDWERFVEDPDGPLPYIYKDETASPCIAIEAPLLPAREEAAP